jgi:hypothetical protein
MPDLRRDSGLRPPSLRWNPSTAASSIVRFKPCPLAGPTCAASPTRVTHPLPYSWRHNVSAITPRTYTGFRTHIQELPTTSEQTHPRDTSTLIYITPIVPEHAHVHSRPHTQNDTHALSDTLMHTRLTNWYCRTTPFQLRESSQAALISDTVPNPRVRALSPCIARSLSLSLSLSLPLSPLSLSLPLPSLSTFRLPNHCQPTASLPLPFVPPSLSRSRSLNTVYI